MTNYSVISVQSEKKTSSRPHGLNTVELLKVASSGLGMGPQHTMHVAERLYIQGYISYPRTETSKYPAEFNIREVLQELKGSAYLY
jgi:DNA topoisomerase-3